MTDSRNYFEQSQLWGQEPSAYQYQVRQDILSMIGPDVRSVLDVGCGDGFVLDALPASLEAQGVDLSAQALAHVKRPTRQASITALPFADGSFDLVMTNDVLEHLGDEDFAKAVAELRRVSRRYVLVTTPFMENLRAGMTRCGACGQRYHVNHHVRNFGVREAAGMLGDVPAAAVVFTGAAVDGGEVASRELRAKLDVAAQWDLAMCPHCNARASLGGAAELRHAVDRAAVELARLRGPMHFDRSEIMVLFDKQSQGSASGTCPTNSCAAPALVTVAARQCTTVPANVVTAEGHLCLHPDSALPEDVAVHLCLQQGGCVFLYSSPDRAGGAFRVPAWFASDRLVAASAAPEGSPSPADARELLLVAMEAAIARADARTVDLQNANATIQVLQRQAGQRDQLEVTLQNLRAENDGLKLRAGQMEQLLVDIQNLRAENATLRGGRRNGLGDK